MGKVLDKVEYELLFEEFLRVLDAREAVVNRRLEELFAWSEGVERRLEALERGCCGKCG